MQAVPKKQLKLWLPLMILLPLWGGSFFAGTLGERAVVARVQERLTLALHAYGSYLGTVLDNQQRNLTLFVAGAVGNRPRGSKAPAFHWDYLSRYVPEAVGCVAVGLNGGIVSHTGTEGQPAPFQPGGEVPMNLTEPKVTDPAGDPSDPSGRSFYDIYLPWIESEASSYGTIAGTVVCRVTNTLSQALTQYRQELGFTGDVYLVAAKTRLLLTEPRSSPGSVGRRAVDTQGVRQALAEGEGHAFYADYRGVPVMGAFWVLPEYDWILLAEMAKDEALATMYRLRLIMGLSLGFVSVVATLLGWRYGRQLEEKERIARELQVASEIQCSILPHRFPPFPERKEFELYATTVPAREMGGDFFDFFFIDHDRLALLIADVSGKGMPAALFMAVSRTMLRGTAMQVFSPAECLAQVNNLLCPDNEAAMFVTVFQAVLHTKTGELTYCNAGHNVPYRLSARGEASRLGEPGGMALGVLPDNAYKEARIALQPRETLFLYTDGVTEAMDPYGNLYSDDRLEVLLHGSREGPVELVQRTVGEVRAYAAGEPQSDDITVLALRYLGDGKGDILLF